MECALLFGVLPCAFRFGLVLVRVARRSGSGLSLVGRCRRVACPGRCGRRGGRSLARWCGRFSALAAWLRPLVGRFLARLGSRFVCGLRSARFTVRCGSCPFQWCASGLGGGRGAAALFLAGSTQTGKSLIAIANFH